MQKIYEHNEPVHKKFRHKKFVICTVLLTAFLCTGVLAGAKVWNLKGPENTSYKFMIEDNFGFSEYKPDRTIRGQCQRIMPGELLEVYEKDNPKTPVYAASKPVVVLSEEELYSKYGNMFRLPTDLPQGYSFNFCSIQYRINRDNSNEDIVRIIEDSDSDYIFKFIKPTNEVSDYTICYTSNNVKERGTIQIRARLKYSLDYISQLNQGQKATKVKINNFEAMHIKDKPSEEIMWLEQNNDSATLFTVGSVFFNEDTKDMLIKVAESMK